MIRDVCTAGYIKLSSSLLIGAYLFFHVDYQYCTSCAILCLTSAYNILLVELF